MSTDLTELLEITAIKIKVSGRIVRIWNCDVRWAQNFTWRLDPNGRPCRRYGGKIIYLGREIVSREIGSLPKNIEVDHIDRDPLNNGRDNLRFCTRAQNSWNTGPHKGKKLKGIRKIKHGWEMRISSYGNIYSWVYDSLPNCISQYNSAAKFLHGEFAYLNHEVKNVG